MFKIKKNAHKVIVQKKNVNLKKSIRKKNYKLKAGSRGGSLGLEPPPSSAPPPLERLQAIPVVMGSDDNSLLPPSSSGTLQPSDYRSYRQHYNQLNQVAEAALTLTPDEEWKQILISEYQGLKKNLETILSLF